MRAEAVVPRQVELTLSKPDNQFRIENHADEVHIRAARDNLSAQQKLYFIRYLAAEGYVPERYQWFADLEAGRYSGLEWSVDNSSLARADGAQRRALRQVLRVLWCATLLWLALMSFAFVRACSLMPAQNHSSRRAKLSHETSSKTAAPALEFYQNLTVSRVVLITNRARCERWC